MRLTNRKTYSDLKNNAERLQAKGMEVSISDLMYIKLAEYENAEEDAHEACNEMQACGDKDHTKGGMRMDLDEVIKQLEDPRVDCITFRNSDLTAWLRELRDARELIRKQSAAIESQARYIETHIDRR
jgi:hypothetical protein